MRRTYATLKQQLAAGTSPTIAALGEALSPEQHAELAALDRAAATNSLAASIVLRALGPEPLYQKQQDGKTGAAAGILVSFDFALTHVFPTLGVKSQPAKT